jgi:glucosamine-6-phosphate deaminase
MQTGLKGVELMKIRVFQDKQQLGQEAASQARRAILDAVKAHGQARIVAASAASQFEMLQALTAMGGIDWSRVELFHLDEYIGITADHPASFRKYLLERLVRPTGLLNYHFLEGENDPQTVCQTMGNLISAKPIDAALVGIGENGHLAFNDPPADFETDRPFLIVELDEACRRQQVGEGWFATIDDVPKQAVTMSIRQISRAKEIVCVVPDLRKAEAVRACFTGAIRPEAPASILRAHPNATVYLDTASASLLPADVLASFEVSEDESAGATGA